MSDLTTRIGQLRSGALEELKPAQALELARLIREGGESCGLKPLRVAFLSSCSLEFGDPYLTIEGARRGLGLDIYHGPFAQFEQEVADPDSGLARFAPDVLILVMRPEDIDPDAVHRYYASDGRRFGELSQNVIDRIASCLRRFRSGSRAPVLVANFAAPSEAPLGVFDANVGGSLTYALAESNLRLREAVAGIPEAFVWDYCGLVVSQGAADWTDRRLMALARVPVSSRRQPVLARHLAQTICGVLRPPAKCLVLDLDNTLWGGVIGDDGLEGIQLGDDHPGLAYKSFQRAVLGLRDRGILLAVASKNDLDPAKQAFTTHPEMLIRWDDLAAVRIDWEPKSENLRQIAAELNLGADALAFFDDNPVEREEVRINAPDIRVIEVPRDPLRWVSTLAECGEFDAVGLTQEDRSRGDLYRDERGRRLLEGRSGSLEEFLESLEMRAAVGRVDSSTLPRLVQLLAKTNQFNLTTRRHGAAEVESMARCPDQVVSWLRLRDRYGDAGLVAVGILRREGEVAVIDTFLMSCRVMGRCVEQALLARLADEAHQLGCTRLLGDYLPTAKNGVVETFYPDHGFEPRGDLPGGGSRYQLDLRVASVEWPEFIRREDREAPARPSARTP